MHSIGFLAYTKKKKSSGFYQHPGSFFFFVDNFLYLRNKLSNLAERIKKVFSNLTNMQKS